MAKLLARQKFKRELREHEPVPPAELVEECSEIYQDRVKSRIMMETPGNFLASTLLLMCEEVWTTQVPTAAVMAKPGTGVVLAINPYFWKYGLVDDHSESHRWVIYHEMFHVILSHLSSGPSKLPDGSLSLEYISQEIICNRLSSLSVNGSEFTNYTPRGYPRLEDGSYGTEEMEVGISPKRVYNQYKTDLKAQGKDPVDFTEFVASQTSVLSCIDMMTSPPRPPRAKSQESQGCSTCGSQVSPDGGAASQGAGDSSDAGDGGSGGEPQPGSEEDSSDDAEDGGSGGSETGQDDSDAGDNGGGSGKCPECGSEEGSGGQSACGSGSGGAGKKKAQPGWVTTCEGPVSARDQDDESGDGHGHSHGSSPEEISAAVDQSIESAVRNAQANNESAKRALRDLMGATDGDESASRMWGDYGAGALFGEETKQQHAVNFWKQWLKSTLASRLEPGTRPIVNKRLVAIDMQLRRDSFLVHRGKQRQRLLHVYIDTSGSMPDSVLQWMNDYVGEEEELSIEYFCFDCAVYPIKPGDKMQGRGGTNFQICSDHVDSCDEIPDAVVMFTDGFAPPITQPDGSTGPADPEKWVWLITPEGSVDDWMEDTMAVYQLSSAEMDDLRAAA